MTPNKPFVAALAGNFRFTDYVYEMVQ